MEILIQRPGNTDMYSNEIWYEMDLTVFACRNLFQATFPSTVCQENWHGKTLFYKLIQLSIMGALRCSGS